MKVQVFIVEYKKRNGRYEPVLWDQYDPTKLQAQMRLVKTRRRWGPAVSTRNLPKLRIKEYVRKRP